MSKNLYGLKVSVTNIKVHEFYKENGLEDFIKRFYKTLKRYDGASNYKDHQEEIRRNGGTIEDIKKIEPYIFTSNGTYIDENGEEKEREFEYKFYDFQHDDLFMSIKGRIHKEYKMFRNIVVEGDLVAVPFENNEIIDFYYSVPEEKIVFYRKQRFGQNEIKKALEGFLNNFVQDGFVLGCEIIREGMSLEELKTKIMYDGNLKRLTLKYKVPNMPASHSEAFLRNQNKAYRESMEDANLREVEETYIGYDDGLIGSSYLIMDAFERATSMLPEEANDIAVSNRYISADLERIDGTKESTETSKAKTVIVDDSELDKSNFITTVRKFLSIF